MPRATAATEEQSRCFLANGADGLLWSAVAAVAVDLQGVVDVAEAVAFHKNIVHDDANIKALADRATANAANISTLDATTLSQASQISTITQMWHPTPNPLLIAILNFNKK